MTHTLSRCGKTYNVLLLWSMVANREAQAVCLSGLYIDRSSRSGFSKRCYQTADLSYPIIIWRDAPSNKDRILDGRHRAAKAVDLGLVSIDAIMVPTHELDQCLL